MRNLNLHAGGDLVSRDVLATLAYPSQRGSRHVVRPFDADLELLESTLGDFGYRITDEAIGVKFNAEQQAVQYFGAVEVRPIALEGEYLPADERSIVVGLRGSSDSSITRGICGGTSTFVCSNLAFHSDLVTVNTKQTLLVNERIEGLYRDAIAKLPQEVERDNQRIEAYKNKVLKRSQGDSILIELVRRNVLNASDLPTAIKEWDEPRHAEHAQHGRTVYQLFNSVTEAIKPRGNSGRGNIAGAWNRTLPLIKYLDQGCGLATVH